MHVVQKCRAVLGQRHASTKDLRRVARNRFAGRAARHSQTRRHAMNSVDDIDLIEETPAAAEATESASENLIDHAAAAAVESADPSEDDEEDGDEETTAAA